MDRLGEGLRLPHPQLLVDVHQRQDLRPFLGREGYFPLLGEELVKTMALLGSHLHLRQGKHLGIRQRGDRWGRGCADRGEDERQRLGQKLGHLTMGQGCPVLRVRVEVIR